MTFVVIKAPTWVRADNIATTSFTAVWNNPAGNAGVTTGKIVCTPKKARQPVVIPLVTEDFTAGDRTKEVTGLTENTEYGVEVCVGTQGAELKCSTSTPVKTTAGSTGPTGKSCLTFPEVNQGLLFSLLR